MKKSAARMMSADRIINLVTNSYASHYLGAVSGLIGQKCRNIARDFFDRSFINTRAVRNVGPRCFRVSHVPRAR
jgi:hypothetical protein